MFRENLAAPKPTNMTYEQAATVPLAALTSSPIPARLGQYQIRSVSID